jgi:hypothetical protein
MTKTQITRVINATVRLKGRGGQGVLVTGGFILTAAHCMELSLDGGLGLQSSCALLQFAASHTNPPIRGSSAGIGGWHSAGQGGKTKAVCDSGLAYR